MHDMLIRTWHLRLLSEHAEPHTNGIAHRPSASLSLSLSASLAPSDCPKEELITKCMSYPSSLLLCKPNSRYSHNLRTTQTVKVYIRSPRGFTTLIWGKKLCRVQPQLNTSARSSLLRAPQTDTARTGDNHDD